MHTQRTSYFSNKLDTDLPVYAPRNLETALRPVCYYLHADHLARTAPTYCFQPLSRARRVNVRTAVDPPPSRARTALIENQEHKPRAGEGSPETKMTQKTCPGMYERKST